MKSKSSRVDWLKTLGASSLLAATLPLTTTNCAYANADRAATHLHNASARENWRAERYEARDARRELRMENRASAAQHPLAHAAVSAPNIQAVSTHIERGNTAVLFPGQVSTFRTSRPQQYSTYIKDGGKTKALARGVSLDLSSTAANITIGENLLDGSITIQVGDETKQLAAGSKVTAAEFAAINQKLATGSQGLVLTSGGAAASGNLNLNLVSDDGKTIRTSQLVVPQNVTVAGDFGRTADGVRVTKDLVNYGSLIATSTNANKNTALIAARDINNEQGGTIASQSTVANPGLNLALRADRDLNNDGSISSAGDLELSAGRSLNNHGSVSAAQNITLTGANDADLTVNNIGGTMSAVNGAINLRGADYKGSGNSTIYGGDLISQELNINAGQGTGDVFANQITGVVNSSGFAAHVSANTGNLMLGRQCLTGDPTYFNTGNIIIGGDIIVGEDLAIIAGGDITTNQTTLLIQAFDGSGNGADITMLAGAQITAGTGELNPPGGPATLTVAGQAATSPVTVSGVSATGGNIDLTFATTSLLIQSDAVVANGNGGNITLAAFANGANKGRVLLNSNSNIALNGNTAGNNGNLTVVAGGTSGTSIQLGNINNSNGNGTTSGTGLIYVVNAQPTTSNGNSITYDTNGSILTGNTIVPSGILQNNASMLFSSDIFNRTQMIINAGNNATFSGNVTENGVMFVSTAAGDVSLQAVSGDQLQVHAANNILSNNNLSLNVVDLNSDNNITISGIVNTQTTTMLALGNIQIDNTQNADLGMLIVAGGSIFSSTQAIDMSGIPPSGNGANIVLAAGANFTDNGTSVKINGASGTGGDIDFTAGSGAIATSTSSGAGGRITLMAFHGGVNDGAIDLQNSLLLTGGTTGNNGNVFIVAGNTSGLGIRVGDIEAFGSATTGGAVRIETGAPNTVSTSDIQKTDATYTGNFAVSSSLTSANIITGKVTTQQGGSIRYSSLGNVTTGNLLASGTTGNSNGATIRILTGGAISTGTVTTNGTGVGNGGTIDLEGGTISSGLITADSGPNVFASGGQITLLADSAAPFTLPAIEARTQSASGTGAHVTVGNNGTGGVIINGGSSIDLFSSAGGATFLTVGGGQLQLINGVNLNASAGAGSGGATITLSADSIAISGGAVNISANGGLAGTNSIQVVTNIGSLTTGGQNLSIQVNGSIQLAIAGTLNTSGNTGGDLALNAQTGITGGTNIVTSSTGTGKGGDVNLGNASGQITLGTITMTGNGTSNGGSLQVQGNSGGVTIGNINSSSGAAGGTSGFVSVGSTSASPITLQSITATSMSGSPQGINIGNAGAGGVSFGSGAILDAHSSAANGGDIYISTIGGGGDVRFLGGTSTLDASGQGNNGVIQITSDGDLLLATTNLSLFNSGAGSENNITVSTATAGGVKSDGGNFTVNGGALFLNGIGTAGIDTSGGTGAGGTVTLTATGTNKLVLLGSTNIITSAGAVNQNAGAVVINGGPTGSGTITANGLGSGNGGAVTINTLGAVTFSCGNITTTGGATGVGGNVVISPNGGFLTLPDIDASGGAGSGDVTIATSNGGITVNNIKGHDISLSAAALITLNGNIVATNDISITAFSVQQNSGLITGDQLSLTIGQSSTTTLATSINSIQSNYVAGGQLNINETNGISVLSNTLTSLIVTAASGNITVDAALNVVGSIGLFATTGGVTVNSSISADSDFGIHSSGAPITLNANVTATGGSGQGDLQTTNGSISGAGALTANLLNLSLLGVTPGTATLTANNHVNQLDATGGGTVIFNNGANELQLIEVGTTQSLTATSTNANGISITGNFTTSGTVTLNAPRFFTDKTVSAASITVQNLTGNLIVQGGSGNLTGTTPTAGAPGSPSSPTAINFITAAAGSLTLDGSMNFTGDVTLNNAGGTTTSAAGSNFVGTNNVVLFTNNWVQNVGSAIIGNKFIFAGVTIINTQGDVNLSADVIFQGRNLAIASAGNINIGNFAIDTSSSSGDGGNITLLAGYTFNPSSVTQIQTQSPFTITGTSGGGGNITAGSVSSNSVSGSGDGGNILVIARGNVSLGDIISTSLNGTGGSTTIIASGNITTGDISTSGPTGNGDVSLSSAVPSIVGGPIVVTAGLISGGSFAPTVPLSTGTITAGAINTQNGAILLQTAGSAMTLNGTPIGNSITLRSGGTITLSGFNTINATQDASSNGGLIDIKATSVTGSGAPLVLNAVSGSGNGGSVFFDVQNALTVGPTGDVQISAGGALSGGTAVVKSKSNLIINVGGIDVDGAAGSGADIELIAGNGGAGSLTLNDTTFLGAADATAGNGNGGVIILQGDTMTFNSSVSAPLALSANGIGTGNGGTIRFITDDASALVIGTPVKAPKGTAHFITASAISGSGGGDGGELEIQTGGTLTVNTNALLSAPQSNSGNWDGATISLSTSNVTGKAAIGITGDLLANGKNGGAGGSISIETANKKAFVLNATKAVSNGIFGAISATGTNGSIDVTNLVGGVSVDTAFNQLTDNISLTASGKGAISTGTGVTIAANNSVSLFSDTGAVGKKAMQVSAPFLDIVSNGSVNLVSTLAASVTLVDPTSAGKSLTLSTLGGLTISDDVDSIGDISITAGGALTIASGTEITTQSGSIGLTNNAGLLFIGSSANVLANNGGILINNLDTANGDISIGSSANIETAGKGDNVVIAIGPAPKSGTNTAFPSGFVPGVQVGKGTAFFGPGGVTTPGTVTINTKNKNVIFNNLSSNTALHQITVGDLTEVTADPPSSAEHVSNILIGETSSPINAAPLSQPVNLLPAVSNINFDAGQLGLNNANRIDVLSATMGDTITSAANFAERAEARSITASDLVISAAFHSDFDAGQQEFAVENQPGVQMTTSAANVVSNKTASVNSHVLTEGNVVFAPSKETSIKTKFGTIEVARGAVVLIMQSNKGLAVYDLHDESKNDVVIKTSGKQISLSPGRHIMVSNHSARDFASVNPIELVQHRSLDQSTLENGWKVYSSEFAIPSACYAVKPLATLMKSKHEEAAKLARRITKTTAVLMTLNPDRGDFVQYFKPSVTAMQK